MKLNLSTKEIESLMGIVPPEFPKYVTQILNLANQNAQGTRPWVVGKLTDLIQQFPGRNLQDWAEWYQDLHPDTIGQATQRVFSMVQQLKEAILKIDEEMVHRWVTDLVITKTYVGLRVQEAILIKVSKRLGQSYRIATPEEESRGIDGWIGNSPVSIKPDTYDVKRSLRENLKGTLIVYEKTKTGLTLAIEE